MRWNGADLPVDVLADSRAEHPCADKADRTTYHVYDRRTRKVYVPVAQAKVCAELRKPSTAPNPVAKKRVNDGPDEKTVDAECQEFPSFGHGPGRNRGSGIHEDDFEEEQCKHADVIGTGQRKTVSTEQSERMSQYTDCHLAVKSGKPAQGGKRRQSAEHDGESAEIPPEHAKRVDQYVHAHRVSHVL